MVSPELQMTSSDQDRERELESANQWASILGRFGANCKPVAKQARRDRQ